MIIFYIFSAEGAGEEEEPVRHKLCPNSGSEMTLSNLAGKMANGHLKEQSVSSIASSSSILDKTAFLSSDVGPPQLPPRAEGM